MSTHPVVAAATALQPLITEYRLEAEETSRLNPAVVEAAGKAGLFRLYAPAEVGGLEVNPVDAFKAIEAVSAADPALSWYIVNSVPACLAAAGLPEQERNALFAEPDKNFGFSAVVSGRAVPEGDGYRLSGSWPVVTGCVDSRWCALLGMVVDGDAPRQVNGKPDARIFLVPTEKLEIFPTWKNSAVMRGTGSNEAHATDVFIPENFAYKPGTAPVFKRPHYTYPPQVHSMPLFAAVVIGVLSSALDSATEEIANKISGISGQSQREQPASQELISESNAMLRAIRYGCLEAMERSWELASKGEEIPLKLRAEVYSSCFLAADLGREMISKLYAKGTRAAFMQGHPLERALRNIHAIVGAIDARRAGFQYSAGRVLLGGEPMDPGF
ncbi:MAG: acyl-CoA dehydrogenase family protein [Candidatus Reddybacter sp.]